MQNICDISENKLLCKKGFQIMSTIKINKKINETIDEKYPTQIIR